MRSSSRFFLPAVIVLIAHSTFAQSFKVGTLDIYGNGKTDTGIILKYLGVREDDSITRENFKSAERAAVLEKIPGVKHATVNPVCCDTSGNLMLFIGIGENDSCILKYKNAPKQNIMLPHEMIDAYNNFSDQIEPSIQNGQASEDHSQGYALNEYPPLRKEQNKFIAFARQDFALLENVLKNSMNAEHRATAAQIIAYSLNRKKVVDDLLSAIDDPDETVRNNATRALSILAGYITMHPELKITIPAEPFIRMINSIVWTDRNKGAMVLMQLTQNRDRKLLQKIKQQALPSIIEMAKWKDRGHAYYSFVLLGRIAGADEKLLAAKNFSRDWPAEVEAMIGKCCQQ